MSVDLLPAVPAVAPAPPDLPRVISSRPAIAGGVGATLLCAWLQLLQIHLPILLPGLSFAVLILVLLLLNSLAFSGMAPDPVERSVSAIALSLLELMVAGLVGNTLLPSLGVRRPLSIDWCITYIVMTVVVMAIVALKRGPATIVLPHLPATRRERRVLAWSPVLPVLAVVGANRLNNGSSGSVTYVMLALAVVFLAVTALRLATFSDTTLCVALYCVSLSLLFMTSLRGWHTTGHDVQSEMNVFVTAARHAHWTASDPHNAYNACLSITILPVLLLAWTHVDDAYVYKVLFQLLFATCPVIVYRLARHMTRRRVAYAAAVYFVGFVTFFQDMPMLNRQEIAYLFFAVGLLQLLRRHRSSRHWEAWFVVFNLGMVVSHYSTTYFAAGTYLVYVVVGWTLRLVRRRSAARPSRFGRAVGRAADDPWERLPVRALAAVLAVAFLWSSVATRTESAFTSTVRSTVDALTGSGGVKSSDLSYSIIPTGGSERLQLGRYVTDVNRATAPGRAVGFYYPARAVSPYSSLAPAPTPMLKLTGIGRALRHAGVNVESINSSLRQAQAWLLQLLLVAGLAVLAFARRPAMSRRRGGVPLMAAGLVMLAAIVVLPELSVDYGVLRALLQFLVFGAPLLSLPLGLLSRRLPAYLVKVIVSLVPVAFLASSTGLVTQATGGYGPQLHLNSSGDYYQQYELLDQEVAGLQWYAAGPQRLSPTAPIQMDYYMLNMTRSLAKHMPIVDTVFPPEVRTDSYVFLSGTNTGEHTSYQQVDGEVVAYRYSTQFLDEVKPLLYDNGTVRIYGPARAAAGPAGS